MKTNDKHEARKDGTGLDKATQDNKRQHNTTPNNSKQDNHTHPTHKEDTFLIFYFFFLFVFGAQKQMVRTNLNVQTKWLY